MPATQPETGPQGHAVTPAPTATATAAVPPKLQVRNIHKHFGDRHVLRGIDLDVHRGEVIGILGPNGCGKSTLLRCINCLEPYHDGHVALDGDVFTRGRSASHRPSADEHERARQLRQRVGMVFQRFNLFAHLTAIQNVMSGPRRVLKMPVPQAREVALKMLETVGLSDKADHYPSTLSGGQQQRVAIARAMAMNPDVMLFDEATSALDPVTSQEVMATMRNLANAGITMLVVTHHLKFCRDLSHRVVFMNGGVVEVLGTPDEIFDAPATPALKRFLETEN